MAWPNLLLHRLFRHRSPPLAAARLSVPASSPFSTKSKEEQQARGGDKWFTLPPYAAAPNAAALGKRIAGAGNDASASSVHESPNSTALKWIVHCCPDIPRTLVQKLFRLRQVRRECSDSEHNSDDIQKPLLKRVGAKDVMNSGDRIFLPITVKEVTSEKKQCFCNEQEIDFIRSLVLYKDPAIIVVNKPPGMPVQGGIGIKTSLDALAITCLSYGSLEPPRLVHRLDKDCSGILVMGRTQTSATVLHSIFREKTFGASNDETVNGIRVLQRKYWALVIGSPRHPKGLISAPLGKVVLDNGKADVITVVNDSTTLSSQHAVTKYKVIGSSSHGYTWLELYPLTGRKHQLRVHCAEVLGTPIVGDYKYGWQAHRNWKPLGSPDLENKRHDEDILETKNLPFGLNVESGSVLEKHPRLHLHCKHLVLPNIARALENARPGSDLSRLESLELEAPLPRYMQKSWNILHT